MSQKPIEVILMRQLASYLRIPTFAVGADGTLLFYNEPAEPILGRRFDEAGEMALDVWSTIFLPTDEHGSPLPPEAVPLVVALRERRPVHRTIGFTGLDGVKKIIEVTAFPLESQGDRHLGAVAMFWAAESREDYVVGDTRILAESRPRHRPLRRQYPLRGGPR